MRSREIAVVLWLAVAAAGCLSPGESGDHFESSPGPSPVESPAPTSTPDETPSPEPETTPTPGSSSGGDCQAFTSGSPVGLACLHCMHPNAHGQAFELARIMRDSCRRELATDVLIDGRFGNDDIFLGDLLHFLAEDRRLTVVFYLSNGVSQRLSDPFDPAVFGSGVSAETFRDKIVHDPAFREAYRNIVRRVLAIRSRLPDGTTFVLIPELEDNLTDFSFNTMLALTAEVAGDSVVYGRNPCPGCHDGNGEGIPPGVIEDVHAAIASFEVTGGMVTNDHTPYRYSFEPGPGFSLADLTHTRNLAEAQGDLFILWNAAYQGLPVQDNEVVGRPDPNVRHYVVPTPAEAVELMAFLR